MDLNKAIIVGRVTADPQLRTTTGGQSVTSFSVATNRVWTDKAGAKQEETEFHNIVAWGRQAEIASQYLTKGSVVLIEGRIRTRSWQDKQGGQRKTTEIISERLQLGPRPFGQGPASAKATAGKQETSGQQPPIEEIPTINLEESEPEVKAEDLPF
ncbi:MAG: single-stranded DNA-binding protein [bacterium]|nr:single-stranded DNA-binding protein [bacterium]